MLWLSPSSYRSHAAETRGGDEEPPRVAIGAFNEEACRPLDLEKAAKDWPDLNFIVYHSGFRGSGWLASGTDGAVGYLLCTLVYSFEHGGLVAEIDELFVGPEHRRHGIGQALLARARAELAAQGCGWLQLQVADGNMQSQGFYSRLGFKQKSGYRLWMAPLPAPA